ncbi:MAG: hypothetical protein ABJN69_05170 [Hellea sp.]
MRVIIALTLALIFGSFLIGCSPKASKTLPAMPASAPVDIDSLIGVWDVALHFDATKPPSATVLEIKAVEAGALTGSFYGTEFEIARTINFEGELRISFVTSDGSGPYASAARLLPDGSLSGQTLSTGRSFLMAWSAQKQG